MSQLTLTQKLMILAAAWYVLGGGIGGGGAAFKVDFPAVLVVEESADRGKYTQDQLNVIQATDAGSVKANVEGKGGKFIVLDKDDANSLEKADAWVKEAFPVAAKNPLPWVVGANKSKGFSTALTTEAEILKKAKGL